MWLVPLVLLAISVGSNHKKIQLKTSLFFLLIITLLTINHLPLSRVFFATFIIFIFFFTVTQKATFGLKYLRILPFIAFLGSFNLIHNKYYKFSDGLDWIASNEGNHVNVVVLERDKKVKLKKTLNQFYKIQLMKYRDLEMQYDSFYVININHEELKFDSLLKVRKKKSLRIYENKYLSIDKIK
ncbi:MAG: hypothetical protein JXQ87_02240 [Bacteroidia bacterium]